MQIQNFVSSYCFVSFLGEKSPSYSPITWIPYLYHLLCMIFANFLGTMPNTAMPL